MGCHFLLQCMKVKSESEVAQSCRTLSDPMDCSLPGSSVHGIFQARVLAWGASGKPLVEPINSQHCPLSVRNDRMTSLSLSCIGEGNGNPLQCSCLENRRDGEAWWAAVSGVAQSRTRLKRLSSSSSSTHAQTSIRLSCSYSEPSYHKVDAVPTDFPKESLEFSEGIFY